MVWKMIFLLQLGDFFGQLSTERLGAVPFACRSMLPSTITARPCDTLWLFWGAIEGGGHRL